jgi:quercetin dioxygenase-like cupin family protein
MSVIGKTSVRRVVTGHDAKGRACFRSDQELAVAPIPTGDAEFALVWTTACVPADNNDQTDGRLRDAGLTLNRGSVIRVADMLPGGASPMHRTNSIDYGVVLSGRLELELEDGVKTLLGPGDIVIQRGTNHRWRNPSESETCRIVFVLIEAPPYLHNGMPLDEHKPEQAAASAKASGGNPT